MPSSFFPLLSTKKIWCYYGPVALVFRSDFYGTKPDEIEIPMLSLMRTPLAIIGLAHNIMKKRDL